MNTNIYPPGSAPTPGSAMRAAPPTHNNNGSSANSIDTQNKTYPSRYLQPEAQIKRSSMKFPYSRGPEFDPTLKKHKNTVLADQDDPSVSFMEENLYAAVLTKPLFKTPVIMTDSFGLAEDFFSIGTILHTLEIAFAIATIILCVDSLNHDSSTVSNGVWTFLIVSSGILLAISLLFLLKVMDFEHNNGIFYCLLGSSLSVSSMGVAVGILLPTQCSASNNQLRLCHLRRAETSMISIGAILWIMNLIQFITVFYICRLDFGKAIGLGNVHRLPPLPYNQYDQQTIYSKRQSDPHTLVNEQRNVSSTTQLSNSAANAEVSAEPEVLRCAFDSIPSTQLLVLSEKETTGRPKIELYQ